MAGRSSRAVLITGCSSGIGRAAAELLLERGHAVYATARRDESVRELARAFGRFGDRARVGRLDLTEPDTSGTVFDDILDRYGRIDALVNNAAFGQMGAVEELSREALRRQFEVNVVGAIDLIRRVLPVMRSAGSGRIINVSSVVAHISTPFLGAYNASKAALNSLSESLRMEVARWGVRVILIEPGAIATPFRRNALRTLPAPTAAGPSAYRLQYEAMFKIWRKRAERAAVGPEVVARAIVHAVEARRPRARYRMTAIARLGPLFRPWLPDRVADALIARSFGLTDQSSD